MAITPRRSFLRFLEVTGAARRSFLSIPMALRSPISVTRRTQDGRGRHGVRSAPPPDGERWVLLERSEEGERQGGEKES